MKPGRNDIPIRIKIFGTQLQELQRHAWHMCEAFGLDSKIENYKGKRPIAFYRWDLDCLIDVLCIVLHDEKEYPDKHADEYIELSKLHSNLSALYAATYESD